MPMDVIAVVLALPSAGLDSKARAGNGTPNVEVRGMADPTFDRSAHVLTKVALVVAVAAAAAIVALSTFGLQWAHTYRQWSMEGLAFVHVGMGLFIASAGAFFCVGVLLWARARTSRRWERIYGVVVAALLALVAGAVIVAIFVESLGTQCFGPCG